jgi:predicted NUDIX family phosphoesterase
LKNSRNTNSEFECFLSLQKHVVQNSLDFRLHYIEEKRNDPESGASFQMLT